jgi:2,4-dienoyl-CoA reductase-like NADH-dependent reductase (Old Yellow Enzyme family)
MTIDYSAVQIEGCNQDPAVGSVTSAVTSNTPKLFMPSTAKSVTLHNRIVVSPMCMDSARGGFFNDFHVAHYGSFALKGPGMIILEATAVEQIGQICINDTGIWSDAHIAPLKRIVDLVQSQGSKVAIQLAHAGRKAGEGLNMNPRGGYRLLTEQEGGWPNQVVGPSAIAFSEETHAMPRALTIGEMQELKQKWVDAAIRAEKAGVDVIEIHSAHG